MVLFSTSSWCWLLAIGGSVGLLYRYFFHSSSYRPSHRRRPSGGGVLIEREGGLHDIKGHGLYHRFLQFLPPTPRLWVSRFTFWPGLWIARLRSMLPPSSKTPNYHALFHRVDPHIVLGTAPLESDVYRYFNTPSSSTSSSQIGPISGVINLCEEYGGPLNAYKALDITQLYIPIVDTTPPLLSDINRCLHFINDLKRSRPGTSIYIHCRAGKGRSATIVACYLIAELGITPPEAQTLLQASRPCVSKNIYLRPIVQEFFLTHQKQITSSTSSSAPSVSPSSPSSSSASSAGTSSSSVDSQGGSTVLITMPL